MIPGMPPALSALIVAFVNAALAVVVNFGVSLTQTQTGSITLVVNAGLALIAGVLHWRSGSKSGPTA